MGEVERDPTGSNVGREHEPEAAAITLVKQWTRRVWCDGDHNAIDELFDPGGAIRGIRDQPIAGPDAFRAFHAAMYAVCDDIRCELARAMAEGEEVTVWMKFDVKPMRAARRVAFDVMGVVLVRDGKIIDATNVVDWLPLLTATGLVEADVIPRFLTPPDADA